MKKYTALFIAIAATAPVQATAADWTLWTSTDSATIASGTIGSINVTYTGSTFGVDYSAYIYDVPSSFIGGAVTNTPGTNGTILMTGGTTGVNTFHFSAPVVDPVMDLFSVGQGGVPVTFNFILGAGESFTILSQGPGHWGGGSLFQIGNSITGEEGNGLVQFHGTYTDISFTTPNFENYYGATVGVVPEPETYAMMLAGLGLLGFATRRRKQHAA
jgi:hypothetical protein